MTGMNGVSGAQLSPRKAPCQTRSTRLVCAVLDAAADLLESAGLEGYTTGKIAARAGISVGSLYQYFPNKDAITVALIERESTRLAAAVTRALQRQDPASAVRGMIEAAVCEQLRRPVLARVLDFEEARLAAAMPIRRNTTLMRLQLEEFLRRNYVLSREGSEWAAIEVIEITRALADARGQRVDADRFDLQQAIEAAVFGYLNAMLTPRWQQADQSTEVRP